MTKIMIKIGLFLAAILIGFLLYKLGNYIWGKPNRGGKRLVLFVLGAGALALFGSLVYTVDSKSGEDVFLFCLGICGILFGLWLLFVSFFFKPKELDKQFNDLIDRF